MARAQNSARGRFTKKAIVIPTSGTLKFGSYSASSDLLSANSTGLVVANGIKIGGAQITGNTTGSILFPNTIKVSGKALTISANTTTISMSGKLAVSGKSPTIEANTTTITLSAGLAISGKTPTITGNTTGHILSGGLALSGKSTKMITGNSTGAVILPTVATLPNTRVLGGFAFFANTTGRTLVCHSTGTTWKYVSLVGTAPS